MIKETHCEPFAITPEKYAQVIAAFKSSDTEMRYFDNTVRVRRVGKVAILPLQGILTQRNSWLLRVFGGTALDEFSEFFDALVADVRTDKIILDINSPGGSVYGVQELSERIYNARGKKPIIAVVNSLMASAAAWIGTAADKVYITKSGEAGSIGVLAIHTDFSEAEKRLGVKITIIKAGKHKAAGNPHEPLSNEAKGALQKRVAEYYAAFLNDLRRNRGQGGTFGDGRVFGFDGALSAGLVDGQATLENIIAGKTLSDSAAKDRCRAVAELARMTATIYRVDGLLAELNKKKPEPYFSTYCSEQFKATIRGVFDRLPLDVQKAVAQVPVHEFNTDFCRGQSVLSSGKMILINGKLPFEKLQFVFAHETAHIYLALQGETNSEAAADSLAKQWGFQRE